MLTEILFRLISDVRFRPELSISPLFRESRVARAPEIAALPGCEARPCVFGGSPASAREFRPTGPTDRRVSPASAKALGDANRNSDVCLSAAPGRPGCAW